MLWKRVNKYKCYWNPSSREGRLTLYYEDTSTSLHMTSPEEMSLLVDILRNEQPVWYNIAENAFSTGAEPVGEEET